MEYILSTDKISKKYKKCLAVDQVSIHIKKGDIYGFIGKNGAGKTTFLKVISGLIYPTAGTMNVPAKMGVLIESPGFYGNMTAVENVRLKMKYAGLEDNGGALELVKLVGLDPDSNKKASDFSLGMKQRLGIALALVGDPELMVLDEPINGLDPQGIVEMRDIIMKLNQERGITFIIASHILEELSKTATRYGIINEGRLILEISNEELNERLSERIVMNVDDIVAAYKILTEKGYKSVKRDAHGQLYVFDNGADSSEIVRALVLGGVRVYTIQKHRESLEEFYLSVTAKNRGGAAQ
ncbi:MAG: ATP-binding cassette domain-containing protein [Ruminococcaceae bacterium]|jgi:ABC-2 type transport system ATP-binding protein|nr:ATP-binding cassette domain-containing protein [Oscillospiraceae bacterium]